MSRDMMNTHQLRLLNTKPVVFQTAIHSDPNISVHILERLYIVYSVDSNIHQFNISLEKFGNM